jgi:hypothetical protein
MRRRYAGPVTDTAGEAPLPPPGPSYLREQELRLGDSRLRVGMSQPTELDEGWWLTVVWIADEDGIVRFRELAPQAGPPADPPLLRMGPSFAGALSGLILEEDGRLMLRMATIVPPEDANRPWVVPAVVRIACKFEPLRVATMRPNELAEAVLRAFRRSAEGLARR